MKDISLKCCTSSQLGAIKIYSLKRWENAIKNEERAEYILLRLWSHPETYSI